MEKRMLTLVIEIEDQIAANWIWESHKNAESYFGVDVIVIAEGNQLKEMENEENDAN